MDVKDNTQSNLNFEINLLPVISLLAVLICALMLTTVWVRIGAMEVKQGVGGETVSTNPPTLWVQLKSNGQIDLELKDAPSPSPKLKRATLKSTNNEIDWSSIESYLSILRQKLPSVQTALIVPQDRASYGHLIQLMDVFKKHEIREIGISPL